MKKRIRKTGEIVDVISFTAPFGVTREDTRDSVSYIDSKGRERVKAPMNIYWDYDDIKEVILRTIVAVKIEREHKKVPFDKVEYKMTNETR